MWWICVSSQYQYRVSRYHPNLALEATIKVAEHSVLISLLIYGFSDFLIFHHLENYEFWSLGHLLKEISQSAQIWYIFEKFDFGNWFGLTEASFPMLLCLVRTHSWHIPTENRKKSDSPCIFDFKRKIETFFQVSAAFTAETWKKVSISRFIWKIHGESFFPRFYVEMCCECVRTKQRNNREVTSLRANQFSNAGISRKHQIWALRVISFSKSPRDDNSSFARWLKLMKL